MATKRWGVPSSDIELTVFYVVVKPNKCGGSANGNPQRSEWQHTSVNLPLEALGLETANLPDRKAQCVVVVR